MPGDHSDQGPQVQQASRLHTSEVCDAPVHAIPSGSFNNSLEPKDHRNKNGSISKYEALKSDKRRLIITVRQPFEYCLRSKPFRTCERNEF